MTIGGRVVRVTVLAAAVGLALPAAAHAHAALLRTAPSASGVLNGPPARVSLTYSEPVEPRFAIVSVTDVGGHQVTAGMPRRSLANPNQLQIPLRRLSEGWYLVFWRVISADGHPVRGAFTFAVGPNAGPAPQFVIPSISETAATTQLVIARWVVFLALMVAIGLFVLRAVIARPVLRLLRGSSLRAVSGALAVALAVALVATPVYVVLSTAEFSLRSTFALGALFPLVRASAFGRDFLDLEAATALFALAAGIAIAVDRPRRPERSTAELVALTGALGAAAAALLVPALAGHAGQTSPRGLALPLDWLHLAAGAVWLGGLVGLVVIWKTAGAAGRVATLSIVVPRFSRVAFLSVVILVGSGIGASILHLPTLGSLWQTSYGKALVVKIVLLLAAVLLAAVDLARTRPRLEGASDPRSRPEPRFCSGGSWRARSSSSPARCSRPRS
jgi:copper transport protein